MTNEEYILEVENKFNFRSPDSIRNLMINHGGEITADVIGRTPSVTFEYPYEPFEVRTSNFELDMIPIPRDIFSDNVESSYAVPIGALSSDEEMISYLEDMGLIEFEEFYDQSEEDQEKILNFYRDNITIINTGDQQIMMNVRTGEIFSFYVDGESILEERGVIASNWDELLSNK